MTFGQVKSSASAEQGRTKDLVSPKSFKGSYRITGSALSAPDSQWLQSMPKQLSVMVCHLHWKSAPTLQTILEKLSGAVCLSSGTAPMSAGAKHYCLRPISPSFPTVPKSQSSATQMPQKGRLRSSDLTFVMTLVRDQAGTGAFEPCHLFSCTVS